MCRSRTEGPDKWQSPEIRADRREGEGKGAHKQAPRNREEPPLGLMLHYFAFGINFFAI